MRPPTLDPGEEARRLLSAVQFLTRLPVPDPGWEEGRLVRASRYFGLVGLIIGAISAVIWAAAVSVLPNSVAAVLAVAVGIFVTGGLHEDGLADTVDGLFGARERARALEIMRDSRVGSFGVLALILAVGLKVSALAALGMEQGMMALMLAAATGRALMVLATAMAPYARSEGLGRSVAGAGPAEVFAATGTAGAVSLLAGFGGALALIIAMAVGYGVLVWLRRRLGGYTGDGLGAICIAGETAVLVVLAGAWA